MIEILTSGATNTVQDRGRAGFLLSGVCAGGAMDTIGYAAANALVGNSADAAVIEISLFPFRARFLADMTFALVGATCDVTLDGRPLPPCWAARARQGQALRVGPPKRGARLYLALEGGVDVPEVLDSRSTDLKSKFGGLEGRGLVRGDKLKTMRNSIAPAKVGPWGLGCSPYGDTALPSPGGPATAVRVIVAAEFEAFTPTARDSFFQTEWLVATDANRMGYRLSGPELRTTDAMNLFSHGIVPGTIQVPPSGQPIVQLADANTCGGYPKIATVIQADLWKLAQSPVNGKIRFVRCDLMGAHDLFRQQVASIDQLRRAISWAIAA